MFITNRLHYPLKGMILGMLAYIGVAAPAISAENYTVSASHRLMAPSIASSDSGFADAYQLTIKPVEAPSGIEVNEGLLSGSIEVGEVGITPFVTLLSKSPDLVAIGVSSSGGGLYRTVVAKNSSYQRMDDLRGKKVAIRLGSGNYSAFLTYIHSRGWQESDFRLVNVGDQEAISALTTGAVDAVIYWEPIVSILIAKGIARPIFSFKDVVENPTFLVTTRKVIKEKPEALARYIATYIDGQQLLTKDIPAAAKLISSVMERSGQSIDQNAIALSIPSVEYNIELSESARQEVVNNWNLLNSSGKLRGKTPDWSKAFDASFIEQAQRLRANR